MRNSVLILISFLVCLPVSTNAQTEDTSVIVNGDEVEYLTDQQKVVARGNVEVLYKGSRLTADMLAVNTEKKIAEAEGTIRLQDARGTIQGTSGRYDFANQQGEFLDAWFWMDPYFGRARRLERVSKDKIIAYDCYITTSSFDKPEYRFSSKKVEIYPGDKVRTRNTSIVFGDTPVLWLPYFNRSLKDPFMHGRVVPGKNKEWGGFLLNSWRYNLAPDVNARIYLDYRHKLGLAEGVGVNYRNKPFGSGDIKLYYTREKPDDLPDGSLSEFERYLVSWRHIWHVDKQTDLLGEWYEIGDERRKALDPARSFLKDYFPREYEKDAQPLSYVQLHRNYRYSSLDLLFQKRTNQWFDQLEKLPEIKYTLPNVQLFDSPFYMESETSFVNHNKKATLTESDLDASRLDSLNRVSLPMRVSFFNLKPFVGSRQTLYDKRTDGTKLPVRTIFLTGADLSTKFFRTFDLQTDFLGLDINKLRHIVTPTIAYTYQHDPTVPAADIPQIDSIDALAHSNAVALVLSNKLQTKRGGASVNVADFRVSTSYVFKPKGTAEAGSSLSDFLLELDLIPYSWMTFNVDATYKHTGPRNDTGYHRFSSVNYNLGFQFDKERSFGVGQRYQRKGGNEITSQFIWRFNPKWKGSVYNRFEIGHDAALAHGWKEQEYTISRDLHSWEMDVTYNVKKTEGEAIWLVFRLKAFPELAFGLDQSYHQPEAGAQ